jgi:hypothetical protein
MKVIQTLRCGAVSAFLILSLSSCAGKAIVRTDTVTVEKPVIVGVPAELTRTAPEPVLPAGPIDNADLADHIDALRAWGRDMALRLAKIAGLVPVSDEARP